MIFPRHSAAIFLVPSRRASSPALALDPLALLASTAAFCWMEAFSQSWKSGAHSVFDRSVSTVLEECDKISLMLPSKRCIRLSSLPDFSISCNTVEANAAGLPAVILPSKEVDEHEIGNELAFVSRTDSKRRGTSDLVVLTSEMRHSLVEDILLCG